VRGEMRRHAGACHDGQQEGPDEAAMRHRPCDGTP
jgi:hypothetical protein